jgi:hypothetical protein
VRIVICHDLSALEQAATDSNTIAASNALEFTGIIMGPMLRPCS